MDEGGLSAARREALEIANKWQDPDLPAASRVPMTDAKLQEFVDQNYNDNVNFAGDIRVLQELTKRADQIVVDMNEGRINPREAELLASELINVEPTIYKVDDEDIDFGYEPWQLRNPDVVPPEAIAAAKRFWKPIQDIADLAQGYIEIEPGASLSGSDYIFNPWNKRWTNETSWRDFQNSNPKTGEGQVGGSLPEASYHKPGESRTDPISLSMFEDGWTLPPPEHNTLFAMWNHNRGGGRTHELPERDLLVQQRLVGRSDEGEIRPDGQPAVRAWRFRNAKLTKAGLKVIDEWNQMDAEFRFEHARRERGFDPVNGKNFRPEKGAPTEGQRVFGEDGNLTTVASITEESLAESKMTQAGFLGIDEVPSPDQPVSDLPMFQQTYDATPVGQAQKKADDLEKDLLAGEQDDAAAYEREVETEQLASNETNPIGQWVHILERAGRFPEEGLTPRQAYFIWHGSPVPLGKSGASRRIRDKKTGILTGGTPRSIGKDYQDWAFRVWGGPQLDPGQSKPFYGPGRDFYTAMKTSPEYRKAKNRASWTVDLEAIDEIDSEIYQINPQRYDPEMTGSAFDSVQNIMRDIEEAHDAKIRWRAIQEGNADALKQQKRRELLAANNKVMHEEATFDLDWNSGTVTAPVPPSISQGPHQPTTPLEILVDDPLLGAGAIPQGPSTQNPLDPSQTASRAGAERQVVELLRGSLTPEEVAALPDNLIARLAFLHQEALSRRPEFTGGEGVNPNAVDPVVGTGDPVELGPPLDVPGTVLKQTTQAESFRAASPQKMLPADPKTPEEADAAKLKKELLPNPEIRSQSASAILRVLLESGVNPVIAERAFARAIAGPNEPLTQQMQMAMGGQQLDDLSSSRTGFRMDPGRMANTVDQGQIIGPTTNSIIEPVQRLDDAKYMWLAARNRQLEELLEKYGITGYWWKKRKNDRRERLLTRVAEHIGWKDTNLSVDELLNRKAIKEIFDAEGVSGLADSDRGQFIQAVQEGRIILDEVRQFQNAVRLRRHPDDPTKQIRYRDKYMAHIKDWGIWGKLGGLYDKSSLAGRDIPDFMAPDEAFNPRELARRWGMKDETRELRYGSIIRSYFENAAKDVFHTEIVREVRKNTEAWRRDFPANNRGDFSLENASDAFDTWVNEAYLGIPTTSSRAIRNWILVNQRIPIGRGRVLPSVIDATILLRQGLTRSVFPLNWTWNTVVQTSSGLLTPVRYGVRNSIQAMDVFFDNDIKNAIDYHAYSVRTKARSSSSVVMQATGDDPVFRLKQSPFQQALEWANFISNTIERNLTRHAVRAAYIRGEQLGYTGAELWQYASIGGARTQSMYNKADTVGALRSREISALVPFQTFSFEMFNTLPEFNIPGVRAIVGQSGAYESFSASKAGGKATTYGRVKALGVFIAGMVAWNIAADRLTNRKPWNISSFTPFWAMLSGGINGMGPTNAVLPVKFGMDVIKGFTSLLNRGEWTDLRTVMLRYFTPGGTQGDKFIRGMEAVAEGAVRDPDRTIKFRVKQPELKPFEVYGYKLPLSEVNPEEFIRVYGMGEWATNGGQNYLDEQLGRQVEGRTLVEKIGAEAKELLGAEGVSGFGGKIRPLEKKWTETWDAYYDIPTDPDELKAHNKEKGYPASLNRLVFRRANPIVDARLFVVGRVSALQTNKAKDLAKELIIEHGLLVRGAGPFSLAPVNPKLEKAYRKELTDRWVDSVKSEKSGVPEPLPVREDFVPLGDVPEQPVDRSSSSRQNAEETWRTVSQHLTQENLLALQKIWAGEPVSRAESSSLRAVFEKEPLGQTNFRKWSKQTLRQVQGNAANVRSPRETVTV